MDINAVRKAMEDLEGEGKGPSVRLVRERLETGGSHTDIGEAIRAIKAERDKVKAIREEMPKPLQDRLSVLSLDFWLAAQEVANRAIEDARHGCELRVGAAEAQASEAHGDLDEAERRIELLSRELERLRLDLSDLERLEGAASERAKTAEACVAMQEAEIRVMRDHAKSREAELTKAYSGLERMTAMLAGAQKSKPAAKSNGNGKPTGNTKSTDLAG